MVPARRQTLHFGSLLDLCDFCHPQGRARAEESEARGGAARGCCARLRRLWGAPEPLLLSGLYTALLWVGLLEATQEGRRMQVRRVRRLPQLPRAVMAARHGPSLPFHALSGKRDRTAFVSLPEMDSRHLHSDYQLLEETARAADNAKRQRPAGPDQVLPRVCFQRNTCPCRLPRSSRSCPSCCAACLQCTLPPPLCPRPGRSFGSTQRVAASRSSSRPRAWSGREPTPRALWGALRSGPCSGPSWGRRCGC